MMNDQSNSPEQGQSRKIQLLSISRVAYGGNGLKSALQTIEEGLKLLAEAAEMIAPFLETAVLVEAGAGGGE